MPTSSAVRKALLAHLPEGVDIDDAHARFEGLIAEARRQWPGVPVSIEAYVAFVMERLDASRAWPASLEQIHALDLYLACGCAAGLPAAASVFVREFSAYIDGVYRRSPIDGLSAADFRQELVSHLLLSVDGLPRIAKYAARSRLRHWVGVTAARLLVDLSRARGAQAFAAPDEIHVLPSPDDGPETAYLRHFYRERFEAAMQRAFSALDERDRELLRYHVVERMPTPTVAALFGVHRGTAARWLKEARQGLLWKTRDLLVDQFDIPRGEVESIMRLIHSCFRLSVGRLLDTRGPPPTDT